MIVVVNSTALIGLARIKKLEILHKLYGLIHVSAPVYNEIVVNGNDMPGAGEIKTEKWIQKEDIKNITTFQIHLPCAYTESDPRGYLESYVKTYLKEEVQ